MNERHINARLIDVKWIILGLLVIILLVILPNVSALGITPAATTLDFESGLEKTYSFSVINSENKDLDIVIYVQGELANYITLSHNSDKLSAAELSKDYKFTIKLPDSLDPGTKIGEIIVMDVSGGSSGSGTSINARLALIHQVQVNVPYPGKYLEAELKVISGGGFMKFFIPLRNKGSEAINSISAEIEIYQDNNKIETLKTDEIKLREGELKELYTEWKTEQVGSYNAKARIKYDGAEKVIEKQFNVDEIMVNVLGITVKDFKLGGVAKFDILLENNWNTDLKNSYIIMEISQNGNKVGEVKTPTQDILKSSRSVFNGYWDTSGIQEGVYDVKFVTHYEGKETEQFIKIQVTQNSITTFGIGGEAIEKEGISMWIIILIVVVVVLIIGNIAWFVYLRKRFMKRK